MTRQMIRLEWKKATYSLRFRISFALALVLSICSAVIMVSGYYARLDNLELFRNGVGEYIKNPRLGTDSFFNSWIGGEVGTWSSALYFFLLPLFAAFPYGCSLFTETKSGYSKNVLIRTERKIYYRSKYTVTFLVGGITVALPILVNALFVACFIPMRMPQPFYSMYYGVFGRSLWSELFYTYPLLFDLCYFILNFLFGGLWSACSLSVAKLVRKEYMAILAPYLFLLLFHYVTSGLLVWVLPLDITPINYLRSAEILYPSNGWIILLEFALLGAFSLIMMKKGEVSDVL